MGERARRYNRPTNERATGTVRNSVTSLNLQWCMGIPSSPAACYISTPALYSLTRLIVIHLALIWHSLPIPAQRERELRAGIGRTVFKSVRFAWDEWSQWSNLMTSRGRTLSGAGYFYFSFFFWRPTWSFNISPRPLVHGSLFDAASLTLCGPILSSPPRAPHSLQV